MRSLIFIIVILFITPFILCKSISTDYPNIVSDSLRIKEEVIKNSDGENYYTYTRSNFSVGWQSHFEPLIINSPLTFTLSYTISNFFYSLRESKNQIGLYNEIGLKNLSVYIQAGPEFRLYEGIFIIPKFGVSFALVGGVDGGGIGFIYFYGGNIGYIYSLKENLSFYIEGGANFIPARNRINIYYAGIGVSFKFF